MENGKETDFTPYSRLFLRFFNDSDSAMAVLNRDGQILAANTRFENLLESMPNKITNTDQGRQFPLFWSSLLPLAAGQYNYAFFESSIRLLTKKGKDSLHWFNVHAWRMKDDAPAGGETLIGLSLDDITLVRQEEKKLIQDKQSAEKTIEAKDRFLANMSHEIRTPIQTIIGMTELLQDTDLDQEQAEYSRQVNFSAAVLLSLINDILDFSKIEAGRMELEHIDFDLEQIIEQAVDMIALEAHKKDLYIATKISMEASITINGDPGKFRQIVINLVKNAVKFTKEGGIVVSARLTELSGNEALCISVADTGIGINEETRNKLFSSFMQADASNSRRFGGTGLGLAISRSLVELMNGQIEMVPNEGGGSVFRFTIPFKRSGNRFDIFSPPENDGLLKILVVDDCRTEREIIVSYLRDLGYTEISEAETGESALKMLRKASKEGSAYQLCFLDMIMPVMDGWRLAAEIQNDEGIRKANLILLAPHGHMGADTKMTLLKWFKAYINKPVKRRRLADTITAVVGEVAELEELEELDDSEEPITLEEIPVKEKPKKTKIKNKSPADPLILIVEDHLVNQKLFAMIIDKLGYRSVLANDGREALEKNHANPADLIFMDIQMPGMNGYEATEVLRKQGYKKPIIAVTASALSDEQEFCRQAGMDDILIKPFQKTDIERMLQKWLFSDHAETLIPVEGPEVIPPQETADWNNTTVFDPAAMLKTFMNEKELTLSLLSRFIERTKSQIESILEYINTGDWENARIEAHTIKGAALNMSGTELGEAALRMEKASRNIDRNGMEAAYPILKAAFSNFKKEAESYIQSTSKE